MGDGANLKRIIDEKGTNIKQVAANSGIRASSLYTIVKRDSRIRYEWAYRLAMVLDINPCLICEAANDNYADMMNGSMKVTVIRRPIAIGDVVYEAFREKNMTCCIDGYYIIKSTVSDVSYNHGFLLTNSIGKENNLSNFYSWDEIGKTIFLSMDDALSFLIKEYGFFGSLHIIEDEENDDEKP